MNTIAIPTRKPRIFLPDTLEINSWKKLETYFLDLEKREINNLHELENWLQHRSELEAVLEEDLGWRYIKMNIDTTNKELENSFLFFINEIQPHIAPYEDKFNRKLINSPFIKNLDPEQYHIYLRSVKKEIEIFREENIPLLTKLQTESQKFGSISAAMTVTLDEEEMTLQKAARYLKLNEREKREEAYRKIQQRRLQDKTALNHLYTDLISIRHQVAQNAGFKNFRDYMFLSMGRFDYTVQDCFSFHTAVKQNIIPITNQFDAERKEKLKQESLRPWDLEVDTSGKEPLKPFENGNDLLEKTIQCFTKLRPYFGECLSIMKEMGHLDLESKKGKAPGGFNYPLYEIGVPFIYMNAVGTHRDLVTMVHEGGHAIHSFLTKDLELTPFKSLPSEVAELASMSMELLSMEHWDIFFENEEELKRAKREQLQKVLETLPWVATIDKFQHWIYENPTHSVEERYATWKNLMNGFGSNVVDYSGLEEEYANTWQKQLHLFEVPFYYIEYGFAQLGAIAVWRNFKQNKEKALDQYMAALSLGYTKSIGEIYQTAGIRFDFSPEYVKELADFVKAELIKI
ncbi:MAG: M3 family oligoendopeptidase [Flavobacteriales bacterium]|nr:M3 family oligoendopeptidase [Flavobacteriales bacterium]